MKFEWDSVKYRENIRKHGIDFRRAALIFEDVVLSAVDARRNYGEVRIRSIGVIGGEVIVAVVHTSRREVTRMISARVANRKERKAYYVYLEKKKSH